ncbi:MAG: hypothetical protein RIS25_114 [Actinomycetota bacterium]|jgi:copper ion binding protein
MSTLDLTVQGMTCNHCVMTVTKAVAAVPGVSKISVDLVPNGDSVVHVEATDADAGSVSEAITGAGYSVVR